MWLLTAVVTQCCFTPACCHHCSPWKSHQLASLCFNRLCIVTAIPVPSLFPFVLCRPLSSSRPYATETSAASQRDPCVCHRPEGGGEVHIPYLSQFFHWSRRCSGGCYDDRTSTRSDFCPARLGRFCVLHLLMLFYVVPQSLCV